jgi:outer membrane protein assembly factor BamB
MTGVIVASALVLSAQSLSAQDWPQWRGPNRDNKVTGFTEPKAWPKELTQKWKVPVGRGDASPVLVGDKLYVFTRQGEDEVTLCLDAASGKTVWQDKYPAEPVKGPALNVGGGHPGPRSTPAVAEGKICTLGVGGVVSCLDAATGKVVWRKDSKSWPQFYTSASPIIVDGKCIVYLGKRGNGEIVAYDLASGEEKWKWSGDGPPYGSPVLLTIDDTKQLISPTDKAIVGLNVTDGKLLWQVPFGGGAYQNHSNTPIVDGQTVIYSGPQAGAGTIALKVAKKDGSYTASELWKKKDAATPYITPVLKDGLLFGVSSGRKFYCMDARTGDVLWTDSTSRGESGAVLDAGSVLLALTSDNALVAFQPSKKEYTELAKYKVADTPLTWASPVVAGNRVFVKDRDALTLWSIQ